MGAMDLLKTNNKWEEGKRSDFPTMISFYNFPLLKVGKFRGHENTYLAPSEECTLPEATVSDIAGFFQRARIYLQEQTLA